MIIKNKKAQDGIITILFIAITFLFVWIMFIGKELARWGHEAVIQNNLTGIEALGFSNLNMLIGFCFILFLLIVGAIKLR